MAQEIHVGDVGTNIRVTIKDGATVVDVSSATVLKNICFLKPDKTTITRAAIFDTNGTDGIIKYISVAGDFDQSGLWSLQGEVMITSGTFKSDISFFTVGDNIC